MGIHCRLSVAQIGKSSRRISSSSALMSAVPKARRSRQFIVISSSSASRCMAGLARRDAAGPHRGASTPDGTLLHFRYLATCSRSTVACLGVEYSLTAKTQPATAKTNARRVAADMKLKQSRGLSSALPRAPPGRQRSAGHEPVDPSADEKKRRRGDHEPGGSVSFELTQQQTTAVTHGH